MTTATGDLARLRDLGRHAHRRVAEAKLGRPLRFGEVVDHRDGNKLNTDPDNIIVWPNQSEHMKAHWRRRKGLE